MDCECKAAVKLDSSCIDARDGLLLRFSSRMPLLLLALRSNLPNSQLAE